MIRSSAGASGEAVFTFSAIRPGPSTLKNAARVAVVVALLGLLAYSVTRAWAVLGELEAIKLIDCRRALEIVSVRHAIVCLVGYRLGRDLLRAVARAKHD